MYHCCSCYVVHLNHFINGVLQETFWRSNHLRILTGSGDDVNGSGDDVNGSGKVTTRNEDDVAGSDDDVTRSWCLWDNLALGRQLVFSQGI